MAQIWTKVLYLTLCTVFSLTSSANVEDSPVNKVEAEDSSDPASRNARYIRYQGQGNPYYYQNTGGYNYPQRDYYYPDNRYPVINQFPGGSTQFYPDRYPNKLDPNYWLSKLPGFGSNPTPYPPNYNPNYTPGSGTNFIGYNPYPGRYPGGGGGGGGYVPQSGYPGYSGYDRPGYSGIGGNGGYGGYQGNGGFNSYSGYDGYYANGNRPGNIGFGYQNSRTNGIIGPRERLPLVPIVTPSSVSKDAK